MCIFSHPSAAATPAVEPPVEYAQAKTPNYATAQAAAGQRAGDTIKSAGSTILTSGQGVKGAAATQSPTLSGSSILTGAAGDGSDEKRKVLG